MDTKSDDTEALIEALGPGDARAEFLARVAVRLGRDGRGREQIAAGLGMSMSELATLEAADAAFAAAMAQAETAARAWWSDERRKALQEAGRAPASMWREAADREFGAGGGRGSGRGVAAGAAAPTRREAIFEIPRNGREARLRDGVVCTDQAWLRAQELKDTLSEIADLESQLEIARDWLRDLKAQDDFEDEDFDEAPADGRGGDEDDEV